MLIKNKRFQLFFVLTLSLIGCTKLPEVEPSSKISYLKDGIRYETFYTKNSLFIEPSKTGRTYISLDSYSDNGNFGFIVVGNSIVGDYTFDNSISDDYTNRINFHPPNGDPFGFGSNSCNTPTFLVSIDNYYPLQQTISGNFEGIVYDDNGNSIEITEGVFVFVKQFEGF